MNPKPLFAAALLLALAGCKVGPDYAPPKTQTPDAWTEPLEAGLTADAADLRQWWKSFNDAKLDSLIDRALAGNLDLKEAAARVREARAIRGVTAADELPTVNAQASAAQQHISGHAFKGPTSFPGQTDDMYQVGFDATWEIDLWGRVRRAVDAADADIDSAVENQRDARVVLLSEVARNYAEFRSAQARLAIANQNVAIQQDTLDLSRDRLRAGLSSELQVSQALAQLETTRSLIPPIALAQKQAAHRLDVLLGLMPGTLEPELAVAAVPPTPASVPVGLPAELLRRRPDIRRAERNLAAATARIGEAKADLYPRFTLSGNFGLQSDRLGLLLQRDSRFWSAGPLAVSWPVFDAGRVRSAVHVQEARQEETLAIYERTVLQSYEEVANALVSYARVKERRDSLASAAAADQRAVDLANDLWKRGLTDFLNVLDTQRALFAAQDQLAQSEASVTTSLIALYKALGGGWEEETVVSQK